jgi:uncharacterized radical SAM superfamily Fe-S cluster-containing enzyme
MDQSGKCYCPFCQRALDGIVVVEDHVWLGRRCPEHGTVRTRLYNSPDYFAEALTPPALQGSPQKCLVVEITQRCDVGCVTCSASSILAGAEATARDVIENTISAARGVGANVVALSGGEPLMRADVWQIADAIHQAVPHVVLITSGRRFELDPTILEEIAARSRWLEIYLQFDSLDDEVLKAIRTPYMNADLRRQRLRLSISTGAATSAVCVVPADASEGSIGELATFCRSEGAAGITFQPLRRLGRFPKSAPTDSNLSTVDHVQSLALGALGVDGQPKPFAHQPFDMSVALVGASPSLTPQAFFSGPTNGTFRVATSSYWDLTNFFEPFTTSDPYYFMVDVGMPLNLRYFHDVRPRRFSPLKAKAS